MKKAFPYILLALLAIAALMIKRCRTSGGTKKTAADNVDRNNGLDRRISFLEFTEHAKCRMECIHINTQAVEHILQDGQVNDAKSEPGAHPCPVYALDGYSTDSLHLCIVFAQCDYKTKVMSCSIIDSTLNCSCGGAGSKYDH